MSLTEGLPWLLLWGTVVGIDLVSFPQGLLNRPLVAATVAGLLLGDVESGLRVGVVLELFALDVLPIGASRYADFGPGAVVAAAFAAGEAVHAALGPAVLLGLILAVAGGRMLEALRRINGDLVRRAESALATGERAMVRRLFWLGLSADAVRSLSITAAGLILVIIVRGAGQISAEVGQLLGLLVVGGAMLAGLGGVLRRSGGVRLISLGLAMGMVVAWLA